MVEDKARYTIAETFVGAGGSHLGFKNNGFRTVYINEWSQDCINTLKYNNPEIFEHAIIDHKDINNVDVWAISKQLKNKVDVLFGGIVCKGFSLAGEKSPIDERNYLYEKQLELVKYLNPRISIIENVPALMNAQIVKKDIDEAIRTHIKSVWNGLERIKGIKAEKRKKGLDISEENHQSEILRQEKKKIIEDLTKEGSFINVLDVIIAEYDKLGYVVYHNILNASWYGSATARDRLVIVAIKKDIKQKYQFPKITHYYSQNQEPSFKSVPVSSVVKKIRTVGDALALIDYNDSNDSDNIPMNHLSKTVKRFSYIPEGGNIQDVIHRIPKDLEVSKFYSRGSTMRLDRNKPSPTLVPGHSNFPVHPIYNRSITVREAAVITGFPLDYKFYGSHTSRCEQVGNAVPIHLSNAIAESIKLFLDNL